MDNPTNNPIINLIESHGRVVRRLRKLRRRLRDQNSELADLRERIADLEYVVSQELLCSLTRPADARAESYIHSPVYPAEEQ